ncbi:hypothetical protein K504DRAFT_435490 [Pleomassaria siparia CBS 279.74]|uniref:Rhodopsin domain-containing protein n=1 Tax=Pleomassaria siparia CBS 279.74 TaxID=1314801 RepID=A0A6G1K5I7_9PLEO|nr:hypothetical protein K504DRAFT_435490 [Pleomassaria siparia CBS 279.74]
MPGPPPLPPVPTDGDVSHGTELNGIIWLFTCIATLAFISRLYARKFLTRNLGSDDVVLAVSMVSTILQCAMVSVSIQYGLARHTYFLLVGNPLDVANVVKWQLYSEPVAIFAGTVPKIAITMLLLKLLNPGTLVVSYLWFVNVILNGLSIVCIVCTFVQCTPTSYYWTRTVGSCWDPNIVTNLAISQGAMSAFVDFSLALYPATVIWSLQMSFSRRFGVSLLMGLGCFAGITAIIRTTKLQKLKTQTDLTWEIWTLVMWVAIECNVIITCACIPSLRPLFRKLVGNSVSGTFPSLFSRRGRSANSKSYALDDTARGGGLHSKNGAVVRIQGDVSGHGSQVSLKRGIRTTTDVDVQSESWR